MSTQAAKLFWRSADTKLIAQILNAKDAETAQKLAKDAGFNVTADGLAKNAPKALFKNALTDPKRPITECSSSDCSQGESSQNVGSPRSFRQKYVFNHRPIM